MGGGAWPFLVGGVICLVNSDNERDSSLLNSLLVGERLRVRLQRRRLRASPNRFIMTGPSGSGSRLVSVAACGWVLTLERGQLCSGEGFLSARRTKAVRVGQRVGSLRFRPRVLPYHQ